MTYADVWNALDPHDAVWSNRGLNWPWMKNLLFDGGSCWVTALKDWSWWASLGHPSLLLPWPLSLPIHCWGHARGTHCCLACWIGLWRGLYPVTSTQLLSTGTGYLSRWQCWDGALILSISWLVWGQPSPPRMKRSELFLSSSGSSVQLGCVLGGLYSPGDRTF